LHKHLKANHAALVTKLDETKQLDKESEVELNAAVAEFKKSGTY
jgi:F-type H+-transporting ATPase subunit alpha